VRTTCGICDFSRWRDKDIRVCGVCHGHLCMPLQKGPRTVCTPCIIANWDRLGDVFDGKNEQGQWIDPGTKEGVQTCGRCGMPCLPMQCGSAPCNSMLPTPPH
jgi:hypothetical protein